MWSNENLVDLADEVTLEAAQDLLRRAALAAAALDVGDRGLVEAHADDEDAVQGGVGLAVPAAVEPVAGGFAGAGGDGAGAAELGQGGLAVNAFGVVPDHDQQ